MHIVLANRWYPPESHGGVAMYNYYLAHALVKLGHRVTVVASRVSADVPAVEHDDEITVHRLRTQYHYRLHRLPLIGRYMRPLEQAWYSLLLARRLVELQQNDPFDIVEFAEVNAEGWIYQRHRQRRRVVVRCHTPTFVLRKYYTSTEMPYDTNLTSLLEKFSIKYADSVTAPSRDMAETVARQVGFSPKRFHIIPNALNVAEFVPPKRHLARDREDRVLILHVGRLDRTKGIEVLARAIPRVVEECQEAQFVFIGHDRPDDSGSTWRSRLSSYFASCGVKEHVTFTGPVDYETLLEWYWRSDIAVVPSILYESFSYTCAQAMAAGLPVVSTAIGGIPETVRNEIDGLLVAPGDADALAQAILQLTRDRVLCREMGRRGSERAARLFDSHVVARQWLDAVA